jgi:carboxyl-terminal processing protease
MLYRYFYLLFLLVAANLYSDPLVLPKTESLSSSSSTVTKQPKTQNVLGTTSKMALETRYLVYCLDQLHYCNIPFDNLVTSDLLNAYMSDLDLNRSFFLESDFDDFNKRFAALKVYLKKQGSLHPAFEIFETYKERVQARIKWVLSRLEDNFDFDSDDQFQPDRKDATWFTTVNQADALWEKRIKYELLNEILKEKDSALKNKTTPDASQSLGSQSADTNLQHSSGSLEDFLVAAKERIKKRYTLLLESINDIEASEVQEIFLTSIAHMYDPHSTFFSADSLEELSIMLQNSLVGIGAVLGVEEEYCVVRELFPGGPAEKSKQIKPSDRIVAVAQGRHGEMVDVMGQKLQQTVRLIRGKIGTVVRLEIQPVDGDPSTRKEVTLMRDEIKLTSNLARAEIIEIPTDSSPLLLGMIDLPAFYGSSSDSAEKGNSTVEDVNELIQKLKKAGIQGLILDLRRNGGGLVDEAVSLANLFIPNRPVVQAKDASGQITEYCDQSIEPAWTGPLIILASKQSASSSEIVIGALKNYKRALIVGDVNTHGKGTVQAIFEIGRSMLLNRNNRPQLGAAKITIQKWYLPDGSSTQVKGVRSDIVIPSFNEYLPLAEADLPKALEWDSITPVQWNFEKVDSSSKVLVSKALIEQLQEKTQERQNTLEEFSCLKRYLDRFREQQATKLYSLNYHKRREEKETNRLFHDQLRADLKRLARENYTSREVLLDVALNQKKATEASKKIDVLKNPLLSLNEDVLITSKPDSGKDNKADETKDSALVFNNDHLTVPSLDSESDQEEETVPEFDIYLREALRIMTDWIQLHE